MTRITGSIRRFVRNEEAATMVEYALMVALIAAVCMTIVGTLGGQIDAVFTDVSNRLTAGG